MNNDDLRKRFIRKRKELGLSQKQVAAASGVGLRSVSAFETGESMPQRANMDALLRVVPVDVEAAAVGAVLTTTVDSVEQTLPSLGLTTTLENVERTWPADVSVFLDVLGTYLLRFDEPTRLQVIHDVTRQIFTNGPRH